MCHWLVDYLLLGRCHAMQKFFLTLMGVSDRIVCWSLWIMIAEREIFIAQKFSKCVRNVYFIQISSSLKYNIP